MTKKLDEFIYPVKVEEMGAHKRIIDGYHGGKFIILNKLNITQFISTIIYFR